MTSAPKELLDLQTYWKAQKGVGLGIVGDAAHQKKGTSYHLGRDNLASGAYSAQTPRDKAGLTNAASAIDLGRLNGNLDALWEFSAWFAAQCRAGKPAYSDVREVIYWDPKTATVLGWSDLDPNRLIPGYGDTSHKTHTHISFYRDSETRGKTAMFTPYFGEHPPAGDDDMGPTFISQGQAIGTATLTLEANIIATSDGQFHPVAEGYVRNVFEVVQVTDGKYKGETAYLVQISGGVEMGLILANDATYVPIG